MKIFARILQKFKFDECYRSAILFLFPYGVLLNENLFKNYNYRTPHSTDLVRSSFSPLSDFLEMQFFLNFFRDSTEKKVFRQSGLPYP